MTQNKTKSEKNREDASSQTMEHQAQKETPGEAGTSNERMVGVDIGTSKIVFSEKKNGKIDFSAGSKARFGTTIAYHSLDNN